MRKPAQRLGVAVAACLAGYGFAAIGATAADVSAWDGDVRSGVRLLAGSRMAGDHLRAGVEIRLKPGWHTYWRYPGDSGIPPRFDFAASRNVKQVEVLWPAPQRLAESGDISIGYVEGVVFPLRVIPQQPGKPVALRLKLDYAVCEKMCIPAEARGELVLSGGRSSQDPALMAAEARVPKKARLGEGTGLAITAVRREQGPERERVIVDIAAPSAVDLFVEGPTPQWALPVPVRIADAPAGMARFAFELDGAPTGEPYRGVAITLTAVSPAGAIEVTTRLD